MALPAPLAPLLGAVACPRSSHNWNGYWPTADEVWSLSLPHILDTKLWPSIWLSSYDPLALMGQETEKNFVRNGILRIISQVIDVDLIPLKSRKVDIKNGIHAWHVPAGL
jgi:hypothetical protein